MAVVRAQPSSSKARCAYHVFLSFRGEDTRKTFTDHLYAALVQAGLHTFRDDDEIVRGEYIESEIQKAIERSRISIIVFSKTYAVSRWCLDELVKILQHKNKSGHQVLPIFYDVDPSELRKQACTFTEAFTGCEKLFGAETDERNEEWMEKVEHWRAALKEVSSLGGMVLQNQCDGHEAKFIQKIVKVVGDKLNCRALGASPFRIEILPLIKFINLWFQDGVTGTSVMTLCGMGGLGKTTIAKFVYNLNRENFDGSSFLANIGERSKEPNGLLKLKQQLLSDIGKGEKLSRVDEGIIKIADAICSKRLLIVLDDVDQFDQLDAVLGMLHLFCPGSKILVTTRHERLVSPREVSNVHQVKHLDYEESLQLFSWHALRQDEDYLSSSVVPDRWEFGHDTFKKGEKHLLCKIHRRKTSQPPQVVINHPISSGSSFFPYPGLPDPTEWCESPPPLQTTRTGVTPTNSMKILLDDNERSRRSNNMLISELAHMRKLYNDIIYFIQNQVKPVARSNMYASSPLYEANVRAKEPVRYWYVGMAKPKRSRVRIRLAGASVRR